MFKIDKEGKTLSEIKETTFEDVGFKERYDIQEWIASNPRLLKEDLLIIAKEFDGFDGTNERLDLLALDKSGNLVVIENKRDDSGRDVNWQAIKYASYCSTLLKSQIITIFQDYLDKNNIQAKAEERILEFFEEDDSVIFPADVRIIMVSHNFRKEVLSAADWLLHKGLDIKCVSITPYETSDGIIIDPNVIIPQEEIKEYTLKVAEKDQDTLMAKRKLTEGAKLNKEFWAAFDTAFTNKENTSMKDVTFTKNTGQWIGGSAGMTGPRTAYNFVATQSGARIELYIDANQGQELNKKIFDYLLENKYEIENVLKPEEVCWERNNLKISSRICIKNQDLDVSDKDQWPSIFSYFNDNIEKFERAFKPYTKKVCDICHAYKK